MEPELRRERRLAQTQTLPRCADVDHGHMHRGDADRDLLAFGPFNRFPQAGEGPTAGHPRTTCKPVTLDFIVSNARQ